MKIASFFILILLSASKVFAGFGYVVTAETEALVKLQHGAHKLQDDTQRILLWNIFKGEKKSFTDELTKITNRFDPDIFLFQEATLGDSDSCLGQSDCYFSEAFKAKGESCGVLTTSQYQITKALAVHSDSREPILATPKTSLITTILVKEEEVMLINTHGINFVGLGAYEEQLDEIVSIAQEFNGPIVWAGDFNSWNPGRYAILSKKMDSLGLMEVEIEDSHLVKGFVGFKLDRIYSRGFQVHTAQAIESHGSDHNPILLEVSRL